MAELKRGRFGIFSREDLVRVRSKRLDDNRRFIMKESDIQILVKLYSDMGVPLDQLPYTRSFTSIAFRLRKRCPSGYTNQEIWSTLCNLQKGKRLPKISRKGKPQKGEEEKMSNGKASPSLSEVARSPQP